MGMVYEIDDRVSCDEFVDLLHRSTLAERRPVDDLDCMRGMLEHADLIVTARRDRRLVGIARSLTDFHHCCYLADLAVARDCQRQGIGRELLERTLARLGPHCTLVLLAAPGADSYYGHLELTRHPRCWVLEPERSLGE